MAIPTNDAEGAILINEDGQGYALYKPAPTGWPAGYLVITKVGYRKKRRVRHTISQIEARDTVNQFFEEKSAPLLYKRRDLPAFIEDTDEWD